MARKKKIKAKSLNETELHTWFERDRQHVELRDLATDQTIVEWWDEAVTEAYEDGFLTSDERLRPGDLHVEAYTYAFEHGMLHKDAVAA